MRKKEGIGMKEINLRKIRFAVLFVCAVFTFCFTGPVDVFAASQTTYPVAHNVYKNDFGQTVFSVNNLVSNDTSGTQNVIFDIKDYNDFNSNDFRMSFYMRGKTAYYSLTPLNPYFYKNGAEPQEIWSADIHTGEKKLVVRKCGDIIGGYGTDIITRRWDTGAVYRINGTNVVKLFSVKKGKSRDSACVKLFRGKLYYTNKCYDLDTGRVSTFTAHSIVTSKNYMYYTSGVNNLVCMDKDGRKTILCRKIKDVIGGNNNRNAVFRKNSSAGLTIYRVNSRGRIYRLTTQKKVEESAFSNLVVSTTRAVLVNGKVCFIMQSGYDQGGIVTVSNTGGALDKAERVFDGAGSAEVLNKTLYYTELKFDDSEGNFGCKKTIN